MSRSTGAVLVTGASGNVGRPLVTALRAAGHLTLEARSTATDTAPGMPADYVNVQLLINTIARLGRAAKIDPTLPRLLGHAPHTLHDYITDNVELWQHTH
jgi:NAD(P)-dependent dehydrogenase (short-subunit alcohol dehydrogenase family)